MPVKLVGALGFIEKFVQDSAGILRRHRRADQRDPVIGQLGEGPFRLGRIATLDDLDEALQLAAMAFGGGFFAKCFQSGNDRLCPLQDCFQMGMEDTSHDIVGSRRYPPCRFRGRGRNPLRCDCADGFQRPAAACELRDCVLKVVGWQRSADRLAVVVSRLVIEGRH